jgi:protein TonB
VTDGPQRDRWLFWLGLALSLALHAGIAAYLLSREMGKFGAIEMPTTAISVNLVSSDILDAVEQSPATEAASAPAAPSTNAPPPKADSAEKTDAETEPAAESKPADAEPGHAEELKRQRIAEADSQRSKEAEREQEKVEQRAHDDASERAEDEARLKRQAKTGEVERRRQVEERDEVRRQAAKTRSRAPATAGASGSRGSQASKGRVSASQGAIRNYGGIVNAWIARNKPSHSGATGTVIVLLAISPSGHLISARVVSSSGNPLLDRSALGAVRRSSPFPPPPPGAKSNELIFKYPCYFR